MSDIKCNCTGTAHDIGCVNREERLDGLTLVFVRQLEGEIQRLTTKLAERDKQYSIVLENNEKLKVANQYLNERIAELEKSICKYAIEESGIDFVNDKECLEWFTNEHR